VIQKKFGDVLYSYMQDEGLSNQQLSEESGVRPEAISRLLNGRRLSGTKVATGLPGKLSRIIQVFIRRRRIKSLEQVENWLVLLGLSLSEEDYKWIVYKADNELKNQAKKTPEVTSSKKRITVEIEVLQTWLEALEDGNDAKVIAYLKRLLLDLAKAVD
jgi:transcriptional regulator with XRE-family HTH domain